MTNSLIPSTEFEKCKQQLRQQIGSAAFNSWILDLAVKKLENRRLTLMAPSKFKAQEVTQRFGSHIQKVWNSVNDPIDGVFIESPTDMAGASPAGGLFGGTLPMTKTAHPAPSTISHHQTIKQQLGLKGTSTTYAPASATGATPAEVASDPLQEALRQLDTPLDSRLVFERFLVGDANRLAHAAALNVVEHMTTDDRLVYFYGGSGRGKTHLLNAIGHALVKKRPGTKVFYLTYDSLLTTYVTSVMSRNTADFRNYVNSFDVLLMDDVHLLRGRKATQEELLNLITRMTQMGKTVVVAGNMAPQRLAETGINQRLTDRLAGGTSIAIDKPDLRLRLAILHDLALRSECEGDIAIPESYLEAIARKTEASPREIEGAFRRLRLHTQAHKALPSEDELRAMLQDFFRHHRKEVTAEKIKAAVAEMFGWSVADIEGPKRPQPLAKARHAFCLVTRKLTNDSLTAIGATINRDHTTIMSSLERAEVLAQIDSDFADKISALLEQFDR